MKSFGKVLVGITCSSPKQMKALLAYAKKRNVVIAPGTMEDVDSYFERFQTIIWNINERWLDAGTTGRHKELLEEEFCEMCDNWASTGVGEMKEEAIQARLALNEFVGHKFDADRFYALLGQYMLRHVEQESDPNKDSLDFLKMVRNDNRLNFEEKLLLVYTLSKLPESKQALGHALRRGVQQEIADRMFPKN